MRLSKVWLIAAKDLRIFLKKRSVLYTVVFFPVMISIGMPLIVTFGGQKNGGIPATTLPRILDSFVFLFIIAAALGPTVIAAYSIVGEKIENSLEPLLATPITDGELLLGKSIAAFLPPIVALYIGGIVFMALSDVGTHAKLGYLYFPNGSIALILLVVAPLTAILSIEMSVMVSARVADVRTVQQLSALMVLPFGGIYLASQTGLITLNMPTLGVISVVIAALSIALFFTSTATFSRDKILTSWK